jgi:AraC-like DNA-binding protein
MSEITGSLVGSPFPVVDDDQAIRKLVSEYLAQNNIRATAVPTGKEMLDVVGGEAIDLIVLDLRLPGEERIRLARQLRRAAALLEGGRDREQAGARVPPRGGLAAWQAKRIAAYVDANLGGTIRADDLAAIVNLSTSYFFRAFRETFGETPFAYVARERMRRAQELMLRSKEPLSQIALDCGLCDQAHFTRVFRRVVGMTPRTWLRQFAGGPSPRNLSHA